MALDRSRTSPRASGSLSVGVLMGGPSAEHAISVKSGEGVAAALRARGWNVTTILMPQTLTVEEANRFAREALAGSDTDVVFLALHGPFGEDGTIQQICEELGIAYTGSDATSSALGLDKVASRRRFEAAGLRVPRWYVVDAAAAEPIQHAVSMLGVPLVVKPTNQGSSLGVTIATDERQVAAAIAQAARYDARILLEEWIQGRELTVGIVGEEALPIVEIHPRHQFFDYSAKYTPGQTAYLVPAPLDRVLTQRVQAAGLSAHQALGCRDMSRVDLIFTPTNEPVVLEVNTIPGFTATSLLPKAAACAGMPYDALCEHLVLLAAHRVAAAARRRRSLAKTALTAASR